ncbi:uncharacterized protein FFB14_07084 [Fusarium fujikuroi]
MHYY